MARNIFDIIFATQRTGSGDEDVSKGLGDLTNSAKTNTKAAEDLTKKWKAAQAGLTLAGLAFLKSVPAILTHGDAINKSKLAMEAFTGSGAAAEEAINAVQEAANFSISKFDAAQNASTLFSLGLADNAEKAAELTNIATTLGATMGKDGTQAFEEFSLMLANQSILRLDTFGISAADVKVRMQELADQGIEPTDRQARFLIATMEIANQKMAELEAVGFETGNSIERLKVKIEDAKDGFSEWLADGILPILDGWENVRQGAKDQERQIFETSSSWEEYIERLKELKQRSSGVALGIGHISEHSFRLEKSAEKAGAALAGPLAKGLDIVQKKVQEMELDLGEAIVTADMVKTAMGGKMGQLLEDSARSFEDIKTEAFETNEALKTMIAEGVDPASEEYQELIDKNIALSEELAKGREELERYTSELIFNQLAAGLDADAQLELARSLGLIDEETFNVLNQAEQLRQSYDAMDGTLDGVIEDTDGLARAAGDLKNELLGIPKEVQVAIRITETGGRANREIIGRTGGRNFALGGQTSLDDQFRIGGEGGNDRVPLTLMLTKGEEVSVTPRTGVASQAPAVSPTGGRSDRPGVMIGTVNITNSTDLQAFTAMLRKQ
jgi:hypothetical protein